MKLISQKDLENSARYQMLGVILATFNRRNALWVYSMINKLCLIKSNYEKMEKKLWVQQKSGKKWKYFCFVLSRVESARGWARALSVHRSIFSQSVVFWATVSTHKGVFIWCQRATTATSSIKSVWWKIGVALSTTKRVVYMHLPLLSVPQQDWKVVVDVWCLQRWPKIDFSLELIKN